MKGINYITNDRGEKIAVMLDLKIYNEVWQEFYKKITKRTNNQTSAIAENDKKRKNFLEFIKSHSYTLPSNYKFNRDELYER